MTIFVILFLIASILAYFIPTIVAYSREHHNKFPIFLVNLLFGWTFVGWAVALVWAFTAKRSFF
jgi:hypothetical protein